jgi:hypothetical protein
LQRECHRGNEKYFIADLPPPYSRLLIVDHHSSMVADTRLRVIVGRQSATVHTQERAPIRLVVAFRHGRWILAQRHETEWCTRLHLVQDISVNPRPSPDFAKEVGLQAMLTAGTREANALELFQAQSPPPPSGIEGTLRFDGR